MGKPEGDSDNEHVDVVTRIQVGPGARRFKDFLRCFLSRESRIELASPLPGNRDCT